MNYELAKKLKDAGFPQSTTVDENHYNHLDEDGNYCGILKKGAVYVPTLSELIEACGEHFYQLTLLSGDDFGNEYWSAICTGHIQLQKMLEGKGKFPEEAVANLWLELNKK